MTTIALALLLFFPAGGNQDTQAASSTAGTVATASQETYTSAEALVASMTSYQIGILRKGPKWDKDTPAKLEEATKKKQEPWRQAAIAGNLVGALRIVEPNEIVGILFFKNQTAESMKDLAAKAPAVAAGLLSAEVQKVWGTRGLGVTAAKKLTKDPKTALKKETYYLVITTKGKNWPEKSDDPATRKATSDQIAYLYDAYKAGSLKYFCSLEDMSQATRNLLVFAVKSEKEAMDLMGKSPAVKNGLQTARVRKVTIAEGVLP